MCSDYQQSILISTFIYERLQSYLKDTGCNPPNKFKHLPYNGVTLVSLGHLQNVEQARNDQVVLN